MVAIAFFEAQHGLGQEAIEFGAPLTMRGFRADARLDKAAERAFGASEGAR
jgi:hypothetical protein